MKKSLFLLFATLVLCQCVSAHMPGASPAPEVDLGPIVVSENGELVEITIDDVGAYHGALEGQSPDVCICCGCTYRALLSGIQEVWGDEIPERSDIGLECWLVSKGSVHAAWYVTGTGPGMDPAYRGEVEFIGVDGVPIANLTKSAIQKNSKARTPESYRFVVTQRSTGETVERTISEEIFPDGFAEMRKKVKFEKTATPDEVKQFVADYSATREAVLESPDYVLFNEVEEPPEEAPDVVGGGIFLLLLGGLGVGLIAVHRKE